MYSQKDIILKFIQLKNNHPYYQQSEKVVKASTLHVHSNNHILGGLCYGFSSIYLLACSNILPDYDQAWFTDIWQEIGNLNVQEMQNLSEKRCMRIDDFFSLVLSLQFYGDIIFTKNHSQIFNFLSLSTKKNAPLFNYIKSFIFSLNDEIADGLNSKLLAIKECLTPNERLSGLLMTKNHAMAIDFSHAEINFFDSNGCLINDTTAITEYLFNKFSKENFLTLSLYSAKEIGLDIVSKIQGINFPYYVHTDIENFCSLMEQISEYESYDSYMLAFNSGFQFLIQNNPGMEKNLLVKSFSYAFFKWNKALSYNLLIKIIDEPVFKETIFIPILKVNQLDYSILEALINKNFDFNHLNFSFLRVLVNRNRPDMISLLLNAKDDKNQAMILPRKIGQLVKQPFLPQN